MVNLTINYYTEGNKYNRLEDAVNIAAQKGVADLIKEKLKPFENELTGKAVSINFNGKTPEATLEIKDGSKELKAKIEAAIIKS